MRNSAKSVLRGASFLAAFFLLLFGLRAVPLPDPQGFPSLVPGVLLTSLSLLLIALFLKHEGRTLASLGLRWETGSLRRVILGTVAGMVSVGVIILLVTTLSSVVIEPVAEPNLWNAIGYSALILFVLAWMEELVFRSYPLIRLSESVGVRAAVYITSVAFALYHGLSLGNLLGPGVWGLFFGLAALRTNGIALATGFHFGLNWMQSFFGGKLQFASSIWTAVPGQQEGLLTSDAVGTGVQIGLLVLGLALVELHVRERSDILRKPASSPSA